MTKQSSLGRKLVLFTTLLVTISCLIIGVSSYWFAKRALLEKGKVILKNGVQSALILIEDMNNSVLGGLITLEEAQESLKIHLMGPKNSDGTRENTSTFDFGAHGYYIIYSQQGLEIMHPTLEGVNVWNFVDKGIFKKDFYLVQDKIMKAQKGGGYTEYTWEYPYSEKLGKKIVYSELDPYWGWVVTAGSYHSDFDSAAAIIMQITVLTMALVIASGYILSKRYISTITQPVTEVVQAMKEVEEGNFTIVNQTTNLDEMKALVFGFNSMIFAIDQAKKDLEQKEDKLLEYAYYDTLSGLPNAYYFRIKVSDFIKKLDKPALLVLVDIKDFNVINSIYGSAYGDRMIAFIGQTVSELSFENTHFARINNNEFAIWIEPLNFERVENILSEKINEVKDRLNQADFVGHIDFYVSITTIRNKKGTFDSAYQEATVAMQYAKNKKLLEFVYYDHYMLLALQRESSILFYAETALKNRQFTLNYQSKVDALSGDVIGVEALARWHSNELGHIGPNVFIPILYKANLMSQFSEMIIQMALDDLPKIKSHYGHQCVVSINISPSLFFKEDFVGFMKTHIEKRNIQSESIMLEITEDVFISDFELVKKRIQALRTLGVKISLDDFGTGYSSLNYLTYVEFDEIKIDKSFIDHIIDDPKAYTLFKSIIKIAHAINCDVIAEGVESSEQVKHIVEAGCNYIQGYVYSMPTPLI